MVLHIFVILRPNFEEHGWIFEVAMGGQNFYIAKRERERKGEAQSEIRINLKMMPYQHWGGGTLLIKSFYECLQ